MTRLAWGAHGERYFEAGTDRGVLYLPGQAGVPWNGLRSVSESPDGGSPTPYYLDGYKYLNVASAEEFKATLTALSAPKEFGVCDGTVGIHNGLFATQQPRKPFNLSYRTMVGNDTQGTEHGYKIHLVYNALASPSSKENKTLGGATTPMDLSWVITTTPPLATGMKPTAHLVIDSRFTPPLLLQTIENSLYGSINNEAYMPSMAEIISQFNSPGITTANNLAVNPDVVDLTGFSGNAGQAALTYENEAARFTLLTDGPAGLTVSQDYTFVDGYEYRVLMQVRANRMLRVRPRVKNGAATTVTIDTEYTWIDQVLPVGSGSENETGLLMVSEIPYLVDDWIEVNRVLFTQFNNEGVGYRGPHFSGNTPDTPEKLYHWDGAENNSTSYIQSWYPEY